MARSISRLLILSLALAPWLSMSDLLTTEGELTLPSVCDEPFAGSSFLKSF